MFGHGHYKIVGKSTNAFISLYSVNNKSAITNWAPHNTKFKKYLASGAKHIGQNIRILFKISRLYNIFIYKML